MGTPTRPLFFSTTPGGGSRWDLSQVVSHPLGGGVGKAFKRGPGPTPQPNPTQRRPKEQAGGANLKGLIVHKDQNGPPVLLVQSVIPDKKRGL